MINNDLEEFNVATINRFVLNKQHLTDETKIDDVTQIALDIGGLHSTSQTTPYLSLQTRSKNFKRNQLDEEAYEKKKLGKIRCMRGTVFILAKEIVPYIYAATKKQYAKRHVGYLKNLGVSEEKYQKNVKAILDVLKVNNISVSEIKKTLNSQENISAIVNLACDQALIIRNKPNKSWRDRRHTYSDFSEYFPIMKLDDYNEEESRLFLVKYYLKSLGPATETDIVWWTGFNKTETREALKDLGNQITKISISGIENEYFILQSEIEELRKATDIVDDVINLLPNLDPYLMGYKNRERYVKQEYYNYIYDRSGNATNSILVNGKVTGIWDFVGSKEQVIKIHFMEKAEEGIHGKIQLQAEKTGEFIFDEKVPVIEWKGMEVLKGRTPGDVQAPLKNC